MYKKQVGHEKNMTGAVGERRAELGCQPSEQSF
jgi:hypothetical protein